MAFEPPSPDTLVAEDEFEPPPIESFVPEETPIQPPSFPVLPPTASLAEVLRQPSPVQPPWEGGVVRSVLPGVLQPEDLLPAVRKIGGEVAEGEQGDTHPDIIKDYNIPAVEIDQRGFTAPSGDFLDRETAAQATQLPTAFEPGRLHSTDLIKAQESTVPPAFEQPLEITQAGPIYPSTLEAQKYGAIEPSGLTTLQRLRRTETGRKVFGPTPEEQELGIVPEQQPGLVPLALSVPAPFLPGPEAKVGKVLLAGFIAQFISQAPDAWTTFRDAVNRGDWKEASEVAVKTGFGAAFTALAGKGLHEQLRAEISPRISAVPKVAPEMKTTNDAQKVGLESKSVEDLESLAQDRRQRITKQNELMDQLRAATDPQTQSDIFRQLQELRTQLPREAIETATNSGSAVEGESPTAPSSRLGPRPLDWRENPEIADWLVKNGPELGIKLPDELVASQEAVLAGKTGFVRRIEKPLTAEEISNHLESKHGIAKDNRVVDIVDRPDSNELGTYNPKTGKIEINRARIADAKDVDWVWDHERAHLFDVENPGAIENLRQAITGKEWSAIQKEITDARYEANVHLRERDARVVTTLAEAWRGRSWFNRLVKTIQSWASKKGIEMERVAAERAAVRALAEATRTVTSEKWQPKPSSEAPLAAKRPEEKPETMGVRQKTREEMAKRGEAVMSVRGQGTNLEQALARGRETLARDPASADRAFEEFNQTNKVSERDFDVARAKYEQVMAEGRRIEKQFGTESPEYHAARMEGLKWSDLTKRMQTEWHRLGMGQQGETDIDTGSVLDMETVRQRDTGKAFTPVQRKQATKVAKDVTTAKDAAETAKTKLYNEVAKTTSIKIAEARARKAVLATLRGRAVRVSKAEAKALADPARAMWEKAKDYIDQGMDDFDDIRNKLATDLGMSVDKVTRLMTQEKRAKFLADDMWRKQQIARFVRTQAKIWLQSLDTPAYEKAIASVPKILFGLKVGFHGSVALGTHAPMVAFQPRFWEVYVRDFGKMYKMIGKPEYYERQIQDLQRRPNYITARRAGLVNDPFIYEDYNSPDTAKYFGRLSGMGNRGYTVLKILRQDMFDQMWNQLPKTAQIPEVAEALSDGINHATGVVKGRAPRGTNIVFFAPRLEASRVMWLAADPIRAANTFLNWKKANLGEKTFAINQVKEKAWVMGTMMTLLALNQGFLQAVGSKQKINMDDPFRSDFLKFKAAGMNMGYGNAMLAMARLPVRLWRIRERKTGRLKNLIYPDEDTYGVLGSYVRSQLSPFAGLVTELWLKADYENRPLPSSTRPVPKRLLARGVKPYTWPEFWSEQLTPIPVQEGLKEVWEKGLGMNPDQIRQTEKAFATIAVMGATGARLTEDFPVRPRPAPRTWREAMQQE